MMMMMMMMVVVVVTLFALQLSAAPQREVRPVSNM
jgi:hypothetical protein